MKFAIFATALAFTVSLALTDSSYAARRVALVIGNANYQNAPVLAKSARNAEAMGDAFRQAGFDVVIAQYDLRLAQFNSAVAQFQSEAAGSDIAVIYFSGYGVDIDGVNALAPVDANFSGGLRAAGHAVDLDTLTKAVAGAKRLRLVILDALHGDPFARAKPTPAGAAQPAEGGLGEAAPPAGTLIAYAAAAGTISEEGDGAQSIYTSALLRNLFTPGLDIRLAFGRVLVDILKNTQRRQTPDVYGSLGGGNISLLPALRDRPMMDLAGEKTDYKVVEEINTAHAWEVFMVQHPSGFYVSVARVRLRVAEAEAVAPPAAQPMPPVEPIPGPMPPTANLEQPPAHEGGEGLPDVGTPALISLAQQELARLGCYSGAETGTLDQATREAVRRYDDARGKTPDKDVDITKDFVTTLENEAAPVCPLACPAGQIAQRGQCVPAGKTPPVASSRPPKQAVAKPAPPRPAAPASAGPARTGPMPGVGF